MCHPFVTNLYQPRLFEEERPAEAKSHSLWAKSGEAGRTSGSYVLTTVVLASALFCGATAAKFENLWFRRAVLLLGMAAFVFAADRLWVLPVRF